MVHKKCEMMNIAVQQNKVKEKKKKRWISRHNQRISVITDYWSVHWFDTVEKVSKRDWEEG